ncbi:MAG: hypothetical protein KF690_04875 [Bacteroidetes bacterium]|nr:hypothetical protein [Bacteroidota bacterium]
MPLLFMLLLLAGPLYAQQKVRTYTPPAINWAASMPRAQGDVIQNIIKFDPLQLIHGEFGLHYERRLNDQLGWEVGMGITFRDYVWQLGREIGGKEFMDPKRIESYTNGIALRTALRLYPVGNADEPNRFFMGLGVQYKTYGWNTVVENYRNPSFPLEVVAKGTFEESRKLTDIQILFGQQHFLNTNMMVEYFAGAVIRFQQLQGVNFDSWEEPRSGLNSSYEENHTGPNLVLGLRIAYGF